MPSKRKLSKRSNGRKLDPLLGRVVRGWKYLNDGERKAISYRVVYAVVPTGRYWRLVEPDRVGVVIIGGEG